MNEENQARHLTPRRPQITERERQDPAYWAMKAEQAIQWGQLEKVGPYLALARYYREEQQS